MTASNPPLSPLDEAHATQLAAIFKILGDPNRVRLIVLLLDAELSVNALSERLAMSQSAVSHQLRLLRDHQIVRTRRAGRQIYYTLDDDHIRAILTQALAHVAHS